MRNYGLFYTFLLSSLGVLGQPVIELEPVASGFTYPLHITQAGDERMFVAERQGKIKIISEAGVTLPVPFLDLTAQIESGYEEQGLLGLAFHPNYAENGYFYVSYIDEDENSVISRFSVSAADSNVADPDSELLIYDAVQPFANHNGGCIHFGPDGYLYIALGDGGSGGDPGDRAQNPENKLGKIHRIDVNGAEPFAIPADNPFVGAVDTLETIWAIGVRNPWRFSFDRLTGDIWMADVGQNLYEELNFEAAGDGGRNYGWRCYEGFDSFNPSGCDDDSVFTFPIFDYNHSFATGGYSVTGGYRYRGTEFPGMYGYYLMADFVTGNWWWVREGLGGDWELEFLDEIEDDIAGFGEDVHGELYAADLYSGIIYKITDACGNFFASATADSAFCEVALGAINLTVEGGAIPYNIEWSTGSSDEDLSGLVAGAYSVTVTDSEGCSRDVFVEVPEGILPIPVITIDTGSTTASVSDGVAWQWFFNGEPITGATAPSLVVFDNGNYSVEVTYENGCTVLSDTLFIEIILSVTDHLSDLINLSPNPFYDKFSISYMSPVKVDGWVLRNILGSTVLSSLEVNSIQTVDAQKLPAGTYWLSVYGNFGRVTHQLIKAGN